MCRGSMIGLVWNSMMSFGGGWFFLAWAEKFRMESSAELTSSQLGD
jgi:NitT/TauT family transport system permease protein